VLLLGLLAVTPHAISTNGGIATYFTSRSDRGRTLADAGASLSSVGGFDYALVTALPVALAVAASILALVRIQSSWRGTAHVQVLDAVALAIGLVGVIVFANPLSNTRFIGVTGFGALLILLLRPRSHRAGWTYAVLGLLGTLVLYPLASYFRGNDTGTPRIDVTTFASPDFDGFQQVINTITYVQDLGITWGVHLASAAAYFVPRSIWHAKAIPASLDVAAHANYSFVNLSLPVHAEFFLEFSWPGLVIGMLLLGAFTGAADAAWLRRPGSKLALFVPYLSLAMLGLIRGPFGAQVPVYLTVLLFLFIGLRRRPPGNAESSEHNSGIRHRLVQPQSGQ
jgi:hypothetical protein